MQCLSVRKVQSSRTLSLWQWMDDGHKAELSSTASSTCALCALCALWPKGVFIDEHLCFYWTFRSASRSLYRYRMEALSLEDFFPGGSLQSWPRWSQSVKQTSSNHVRLRNPLSVANSHILNLPMFFRQCQLRWRPTLASWLMDEHFLRWNITTPRNATKAVLDLLRDKATNFPWWSSHFERSLKVFYGSSLIANISQTSIKCKDSLHGLPVYLSFLGGMAWTRQKQIFAPSSASSETSESTSPCSRLDVGRKFRFFFCSSWWKNIGTWHMEWTRAVAMPTQSGCMGPNSCGSGLIKRIQKNHKLWRARWNYWNIVEVQSSGVQELFQNKWKRLLKHRWLQVLRNFRTRLSAMAVSDGKPKPDTLSFLVSVQRTPEGSDAWIQHRSEHVGFALDWHLWKRDQLKTNNFSNLSHVRGNWHQRSVKLRKWQILECTWIYRILFDYFACFAFVCWTQRFRWVYCTVHFVGKYSLHLATLAVVSRWHRKLRLAWRGSRSSISRQSQSSLATKSIRLAGPSSGLTRRFFCTWPIRPSYMEWPVAPHASSSETIAQKMSALTTM